MHHPHTDNMGILSELHRGEKKCFGRKAKEADPRFAIRDVRIDVKHLTAHEPHKRARKDDLLRTFCLGRK